MRHLLNSTRAASVVEYAVLVALIGGIAVQSVLIFGLNVHRASTETTVIISQAVPSTPAPSSGGGTPAPGGGGTSEPPAPPPDVFASCEAGFGPNPAAIRGNGDGSLLSGGDGAQIIYALGNATVDGGEGGSDLDTLMVPGAGAIATFTSWSQPESGRIDLPDGGEVLFSNIEEVILCDAGGAISPPAPPAPVLVADIYPMLGAWLPASNNLGVPSSGYYFNYASGAGDVPLRSAVGSNLYRANAGDVLGSQTVFAARTGSLEYRTGTINQHTTAQMPVLLLYTVETPSSVFVVPMPSTTAQRTAVSTGAVWSVYMSQSGWTRPSVAGTPPFLSSDIRNDPRALSVYDCEGVEEQRPIDEDFTVCPIP